MKMINSDGITSLSQQLCFIMTDCANPTKGQNDPSGRYGVGTHMTSPITSHSMFSEPVFHGSKTQRMSLVPTLK